VKGRARFGWLRRFDQPGGPPTFLLRSWTPTPLGGVRERRSRGARQRPGSFRMSRGKEPVSISTGERPRSPLPCSRRSRLPRVRARSERRRNPRRR